MSEFSPNQIAAIVTSAARYSDAPLGHIPIVVATASPENVTATTTTEPLETPNPNQTGANILENPLETPNPNNRPALSPTSVKSKPKVSSPPTSHSSVAPTPSSETTPTLAASPTPPASPLGLTRTATPALPKTNLSTPYSSEHVFFWGALAVPACALVGLGVVIRTHLHHRRQSSPAENLPS